MYRAADTNMPVVARQVHPSREIFMSAAMDENQIETIEGTCAVRFGKGTAEEPATTDSFYCLKHYNPVTGIFTVVEQHPDFAVLQRRLGRRGADPSSDLSDQEQSDSGASDGEYTAPDGISPVRPKRGAPMAAVPFRSKQPQKRRRRGSSISRASRVSLAIQAAAPGTLDVADGALAGARARLHVSAVPEDLPCREVEFATICEFVRAQLCAGAGSCMFVSGVPGTGKTATIRAVAKALLAERDGGSLNPFEFVEINGMALTAPQQVYTELCEFRGMKRAAVRPSRPLRVKP